MSKGWDSPGRRERTGGEEEIPDYSKVHPRSPDDQSRQLEAELAVELTATQAQGLGRRLGWAQSTCNTA